MRALFCAICLIIFFQLQVSAQNSPDCRTAIPVCADMVISSATDGSGDIDDFVSGLEGPDEDISDDINEDGEEYES